MDSGPFPKRSALLSCGLVVVDVRQPQFRHAEPNGAASISADCHADAVAPFWVRHRFMPARRCLIAFNDDPHTRHDDVIALLDPTIDHLVSTAPVRVGA